jgi:hypothetical protein
LAHLCVNIGNTPSNDQDMLENIWVSYFILTTSPRYSAHKYGVAKNPEKLFQREKKISYMYLCIENRSFGLWKIGFRGFDDLTIFRLKLLTHHSRQKSRRLRSPMRKGHRPLRWVNNSQARFVQLAGRNVSRGTLHAIRFEDGFASRYLHFKLYNRLIYNSP